MSKISSYYINLDDIIYPYKYLSKGVNGITFLSKLKKEKLPGDNQDIIVKYEIVSKEHNLECKKKYVNCPNHDIDKCKINEIYCRLSSAFNEIYINKVMVEKLNSRNFAMFYAFFMCPTYQISFDDKKEPAKDFIKNYPENKKFCTFNPNLNNLNNENNENNFHIFSVYEYIPGTTLSDYIISNDFNLLTFYKILLQLFGALASVQKPNQICYNHNDLHTSNVMIEKYPSNVFSPYTYNFPFEKTKNTFYSNVRAVIIDQGNASLLIKKKNEKEYRGVFGWYKKKITKILKNYNTPYADVFRIITHTYYRMIFYQKDKKDISQLKKIINELFSLDNTICSDFIETQEKLFFDYYVLYIQQKQKDYKNLLKKIEKITYENAYNFVSNLIKNLS